MHAIPRDPEFDASLGLARLGYRFISDTCNRLRSDLFQTRLLLRPTICMRGEQAAKLFYDERRFIREGAAPVRLQKTLTGQGAVQGLDASAHRERKALLMSLMAPERVRELVTFAALEWSAALLRWQNASRVVLLDELEEILCRAVCAWSGVPLDEAEVPRRTRDLSLMIRSAGAFGFLHRRGRRARTRGERWIADLVEQLRDGELQPSRRCALHAIALHRDPEGRKLPSRIAAVEIINILRPTVAVARFIVFAALALHRYPQTRATLLEGGTAEIENFVQEVRRYYPFFPVLAARVREDFEWCGYRFPKHRRVLLDLYGTDHDGRLWADPEEFRPSRFRDWNGSAYSFISQGGGEHYRHHRCAGEWITIELMKLAVAFLVHGMRYEVPEQELAYSPRRVPTAPKSGFVIREIRPAGDAASITALIIKESPRLRTDEGSGGHCLARTRTLR